MKRIISIALSAMIALTLLVLPASAAGYKAGEYEASAQGMMGPVKVKVSFTEDAIAAVEVVEQQETEAITSPAIEGIPRQIVAGQTLAVDAVSGATVTSTAILTAVEDCVLQAGGAPEALKLAAGPAQVEKKQENMTTDVLVVGGGIAGLSAAMSAADAGAKVLLIDKMPALGGTTAISGGFLIAVDSETLKDSGKDDSLERMLNWWDYVMNYNEEGESLYPDRERLIDVLKDTGKTVDYLAANGVVFSGAFEFGDYVCAATEGRGSALVQFMEKSCTDKGVTIVKNCKANALVQKDGQVVGVTAETEEAVITIEAKAVVLATGGLSQNADMMAEYAPGLTYAVSQAAVSNTGDGIRMALEAGAELYPESWGALNGTAIAAAYAAQIGEDAKKLVPDAYLSVNAQGNRYAREKGEFRAALAHDMLKDNQPPYFMILDASDAALQTTLEAGLALGETFKGTTVEELAQAIGAKPEDLAATVKQYNAYAAIGKDEAFGKEAEALIALAAEGPYYAVKLYPTLFGSASGVVTDLQGRVLKADGGVIPGLYAAGEMSNRPFYRKNYVLAASLGLYATMGLRAGAAAAEMLK
jgi:succinate dehydrogenase/fumarate reductase flavoprotein subunit/uncharacterized protein with FMN-binding domain